MFRLTPQEQDLVKEFRKLPEIDKKAILTQIKSWHVIEKSRNKRVA